MLFLSHRLGRRPIRDITGLTHMKEGEETWRDTRQRTQNKPTEQAEATAQASGSQASREDQEAYLEGLWAGL